MQILIKKAKGVSVDKYDLKAKNITRDTVGHHIMTEKGQSTNKT